MLRSIFPENAAFCIAEIGVNHNGDVKQAIELIDVAKRCGADAVKFQTFVTEDLVKLDAKAASYQLRNLGAEVTQAQMLKALELSEADHKILYEYAKAQNIEFMSTPHSGASSVDLLERIGVQLL